MLISTLRAQSMVRRLACWRRHAPVLPLAGAVMLGQGIVWYLPLLELTLITMLIAGALVAAHYRLLPGVVAWLGGGVLLGVVSAFLYSAHVPIDSRLNGELTILGTVKGQVRHARPGEVTFELQTGRELDHQVVRCRAIDLPWRNAAHLEPGDTIWVRGAFGAVEKPINPFSWNGWLWRRGVQSECKARFVSRPIRRNPSLLYQWRESLKQKVFMRLGDSQGSGLFLSMSLGYQDVLSVPLEKSFMRLGLTHLLVVSGYQVSLAFGFILYCMGALFGWLRFGHRHLRNVVTMLAFVCAALYVVFVGAEMSAVRALIAAACICAHLLSEKDTSFAQRWGVALLGMQLLWPWCAFDLGVVLTFAALFGIGLGSEAMSRSKMAVFVAVTVSVWLCTSLVVVVWQGNISPLGLLLNLVVAAPWSILNCTVGLSALGLLCTELPGSAVPLEILVWINQLVSEVILELGESSYSSWQLEGIWRVTTTVGISLVLARMAHRSASTSKVTFP
ncbi:MAG: ComEC/Rec2 family competence protein [Pseudomonadota bacterium]|jgi:ComEC/Rec2-related protein